jgi:hypothetical protein
MGDRWIGDAVALPPRHGRRFAERKKLPNEPNMSLIQHEFASKRTQSRSPAGSLHGTTRRSVDRERALAGQPRRG